MKRRFRAFRFVSLMVGLCLCGSTAFAGGKVLRFHASTAQEIVDALLAAQTHTGVTVIKIAPGEYRFGQPFESEFGRSVLPPVTTAVVLLGKDPEVTTLAAGFAARLITLDGGHLAIKGITLTGGTFHGEDLSPSERPIGGGAVANFGGALLLIDCVLRRNITDSPNGDVLGGAILSVDGWLLLERTTLTENHASGFSGALAMLGGKGFIRNSVIRGNDTFTQFGAGAGGIGNSGELVISGSTIAGNFTGVSETDFVTTAGGISNSGKLWLIDSAVVENSTLRPGELEHAGYGGGIWNGAELHVINSTVGGNLAATSGGGIFNDGTLTLRGATIAGNQSLGSADVFHSPDPNCTIITPQLCIDGGGGIWNEADAQVTITSSVIADNHIPHEDDIGPDCAGVIRSKGFNAIGDPADCDVQPSPQGVGGPDQLGVDPKLADLIDDGRPGKAHFPLQPDSPLIDAGGKVFKQCTPRDQLGQRRRDGDLDGKVRCDTGAIEFQ